MNKPHESALRINPDWARLPLFDRKGWKRVRFGDVVSNVNETEGDPEAAGIERFIGLEHLEPGSLHIRTWGDVSNGTTFTRRCRPGQVLFGKRRAYQRKVAVAEFDAVVSGDIYVLAPKNDHLLPDLLPFLCMSDRFFQHAVGTSAGSLSPRTNWSSLAGFEFDLPPLDQQRRIAEILWAVDACVCQHERVLAALQALRSLRILEAMGGGRSQTETERGLLGRIPRGWETPMLREVCSVITDGVHKTPEYVETGVPFVTVKNLTRTSTISFEELNYISEADHAEFIKRAHPEKGDVLLSKDGATLGVPRVVNTDRPFSIFVSVALLKPDRSKLDPNYLCYALEAPVLGGRLIKNQAGSAIRHIHLVDLRLARIPLPSLIEQRRLVDRIREVAVACDGERQVVSATRSVTSALLKAILSS